MPVTLPRTNEDHEEALVPRGTLESLSYLPIGSITPNRFQPRKNIDPTSLKQLAKSITTDGIMQPIVVRPQPGSPANQYELVAGERRWRAARIAGLSTLPAIVRPLEDQQVAEWALIENLQREDLNPIDKAEAFTTLAAKFSLSHEDIAQRLNLDRSTVSNLIRLLELDQEVRQLIRDGLLNMGQARAIAGSPDSNQQRFLAGRAVREGWSVRKVEAAVRSANSVHPGSKNPTVAKMRPAHLADLEQRIGQHLGTHVKIKPGRKKGSGAMTIEFYSLDQFDQLMKQLGIDPNAG